MTRTQGLLVVATCVLLAVWLTVARSAVRGGIAVPAPERAVLSDPAVDTIARQAGRLRSHLAGPPPFAPSRRNPFRFRDISPAAGSVRQPPPLAGTAPTDHPPRAEMKLVGIAEDPGDGGPVRTAIVSAMTQLLFVREGDRVLGRYLVRRIGADAVQLEDGEGGEVFTLALK